MTVNHTKLIGQIVLVAIFTSAFVRLLVAQLQQRPCTPYSNTPQDIAENVFIFLIIAAAYALAGGFSEIVKAIKGGNQ